MDHTFLCLLSDFEREEAGGVGESTDGGGGGRGGDDGDGAGRASAVFVGGIPDMMPDSVNFTLNIQWLIIANHNHLQNYDHMPN